MFGLNLITGLPGSSKTLNSIKMLVEDDNHDSRVVFYNNIKLLFLDYSVCDSFAGFFYGYYKPSLSGSEANNIQLFMERVHSEQRLVTLDDLPHLSQIYDAWAFDGGLKLWLSWVRKVYPKKRLIPLENYLSVNPNATFNELRQFNLHWVSFDDPTLWFELPRPCRILIDECQRWFPPRSVGAKVPRHISEFETFRHSGVDIFLITQNAKLLDSNVRRLAVNHYHFSRPLGSSAVVRYHASKCTDFEDYFGRKSSDKVTFKRDSSYYGLYHSADRHTFKTVVPRKIYLMGFVLVGVVLVAFMLVSRFVGDDSRFSGAGSVVDSGSVSGFQTDSIALNNDVGSRSVKPSFQSPVVKNVLPISALSSFDHPLTSFCSSLSLAGYEVFKFGSSTGRRYYLNCELVNQDSFKPVSSSRDSSADSGDDEDSGGFMPRRVLLDLESLTDFGFKVSFLKPDKPVLEWNSNRFILLYD